MKFSLGSDIHLEFGPLDTKALKNSEESDILILAGDVTTAKHVKSSSCDEFFEDVTTHYPKVIWIMGNHEHYSGVWREDEKLFREFAKKFNNLHFLEKETLQLDDITVVAGTLWTNFNKGDARIMMMAERSMNDYRSCYGLSAHEVYEDHKSCFEVISQNLGSKTLVVTHHAPSHQSTHPRYKVGSHAMDMNYLYQSDLSEFILDNPNIKVWVHGHTHDPHDYRIGSTRVICNPRGYIGYEDLADVFTFQTFEV